MIPDQHAAAARALAPYLAALAARVRRHCDPIDAGLIRTAALICLETVDGEMFPTEVIWSATKAMTRSQSGANWDVAMGGLRVPKRCRLGWELACRLASEAAKHERQALADAPDGDDFTRHKSRVSACAGIHTAIVELRWHCLSCATGVTPDPDDCCVRCAEKIDSAP